VESNCRTDQDPPRVVESVEEEEEYNASKTVYQSKRAHTEIPKVKIEIFKFLLYALQTVHYGKCKVPPITGHESVDRE
jgi:hypothetical protein